MSPDHIAATLALVIAPTWLALGILSTLRTSTPSQPRTQAVSSARKSGRVRA